MMCGNCSMGCGGDLLHSVPIHPGSPAQGQRGYDPEQEVLLKINAVLPFTTNADFCLPCLGSKRGSNAFRVQVEMCVGFLGCVGGAVQCLPL